MMQKLDHTAYLDMREGAEVLESDRKGDKVLRLSDGTMLKLFRRKRLLSSAIWAPYAQRFADNCQALRARGIDCPQVRQVYRIPGIERDAVHYDPLPGHTLRQLLAEPRDDLRAALGEFIALLHEKGIYFRSAHLGNVVLTPKGTLGLIDIADLRLYSGPLRKGLRLRNFSHMLRYRADREWLLQDRQFLEQYLSHQRACNEADIALALKA
ncbi:Toluene tolerance protein [Pseudomonas cannabina pv. alisalensis]|uniref:Toluene tolerance protein n=3 Tax=Pseudomonas syringae group TaxID=136849 RepID=A0A3M3RHW9_PSECA|nr:Toluene tolerance protein [Pseudomonas cannabina pv. alisalensis]RMN78793.1 Toluene tolerance protein [Pseudomonas cannabina pv. alisalensis]RMN80083.1 Toluene tolerance protein [Pseudomonas cannabina]RMN96033.1 Toluene tolerance protein [Pseudomonas cannabina]